MMSVLQPVVPILPLPSVVLFPHALLDLRVAGEQLDGAAGEWLAEGAVWGVATVRADLKSAPLGGLTAPIFRTMGIGCIIHRENDNGRLRRLVLEGLVRGRVLDDCELSLPPAVQVEILRDHVNVEGARRKELAQAFREMVHSARRVAALESDLRDPIRRVLAGHPHPGVVADLLSHYCVKDTYAKQSILAEVDVCRRVRLVQVQLARMATCHSLRPLRHFR